MTGIRAVATTFSMRPLPPRGMIRSRYWSILAMCSTLARSVKGMSWMLSGGRPARSPPVCKAAARARLLSMASLPPRRIVALPVLKQRDAASLVTLGRDSKMMPMTPIGTRTLRMWRPLGRVHSLSSSPTGSGSTATSRTASAIAARRLGSRVRRSIMAFERPFSSARARSSALAERMAPWQAMISSAIARRMVFFCSLVSLTSA